MALVRGGALGLLVLCGLVSASGAQTPPAARGYRIVVGDVLQVDVVGRTDISGQYSVDKEGTIKLPIVGSVTAQGRTTTELGTDISRRISLISRDIPQVNVTVVEAFRRRNFVLGAVLLPGSYSFAKAPSVWEAISSAGGPADDADLTAVQIISEGQLSPAIVDVAAAVRSGDLTSLPRLRPGDTVRVQRATGTKGATGDVIYVFGAVASPGPQPLSDASDLVRAIIRANPQPEANLKKVEIVRKSGARVVSMKVNMTDYMGKAALAGNPQLLPGDTVHLNRRGGNYDYLRIVGGILALATTVAVLTNNN